VAAGVPPADDDPDPDAEADPDAELPGDSESAVGVLPLKKWI
jgi:hypothetical protein